MLNSTNINLNNFFLLYFQKLLKYLQVFNRYDLSVAVPSPFEY